jgi:hypothetical protein
VFRKEEEDERSIVPDVTGLKLLIVLLGSMPSPAEVIRVLYILVSLVPGRCCEMLE